MTVAWVLYVLATGGLLTIAARAAESVLRAAKQPVRFVWGAAIALSVLVPAVAPWLSAAPETRATSGSVAALPLPVGPAVPSPTVIASIASSALRELRIVSGTLTAPFHGVITSATQLPRSVDQVVAALLVTVSITALVLLAGMYMRFSRQRLDWPRALLQGTPVRVTSDIGPAVMGVAPAEIVVPGWLLMRSASEQQLVLAHEAEHVRSRDPFLLLVACSAVALMPWNAALWYMWSRLRLGVELDCDQRVLQSGVRKPSYAQLLVALSGQQSMLAPAMPAFSCTASHLEQRLLAMTALPARNQWARCIGAASVVALTLLVACESKVPTSAEVRPSATTAPEASLTGIDDSTVFTVDGVVVSREEATRLPARRIAGIITGRGRLTPGEMVRIRLRSDSEMKASGSDRRSFRSYYAAVSTDGRRARPKPTPQWQFNPLAADSLPPAVATVDAIRSRDNSARTFDGLLVVDGVEVTAAEFAAIRRENIESVEVVKGRAATALSSDPRAINGIIKVTRRH